MPNISRPKKSRHFLIHWMSVKLPDNFLMREHSWPCRFHIKRKYEFGPGFLEPDHWKRANTSFVCTYELFCNGQFVCVCFCWQNGQRTLTFAYKKLFRLLTFVWNAEICNLLQGMSSGKGMESANNDARKWPILPFDVSRDFIISKEILV